MQGSPAPSDEFWMARALAEAARGRGSVEPNPMVGACVVCDGRLVGVGHHARFGGPHAEVVALQAAGTEARAATLYVSLEPCCHTGKTPPCTEAVLRAGVARVVAAMRDPFPRVDGGGFAALRSAGVDVVSGVLEPQARAQNAPYLRLLEAGRPYVTAKWAMTLDGKIACATGDSKWISNATSRAVVHELRGRMDAILVGIGTALADDPELTARPPGPRIATRVVLDSRAQLPPSSRLASTARDVPVLLAVTHLAPADRLRRLESAGVEILRFPVQGPVPIGPLLDQLGHRRATNLLVEGGGAVLGSFFDAREIQAVEVFVAPTLEGGSHSFQPIRGSGVERMSQALRLTDVETRVLGTDTHIRGTLPSNPGPTPP